MDDVLAEEVALQQQTLAVAAGALQNVTITCKQCKVTFIFTEGEEQFLQGTRMVQPARCPECKKSLAFVKNERKQPANIDSRIVPLGLKSKLQ